MYYQLIVLPRPVSWLTLCHSNAGPVTTFIVEPFVPHKNEYYLCISTRRLDTEVSFSTAGGIHIEDNWDKYDRSLPLF